MRKEKSRKEACKRHFSYFMADWSSHICEAGVLVGRCGKAEKAGKNDKKLSKAKYNPRKTIENLYM